MEHLLSSVYWLYQYLENIINLDMELLPAITLFMSEAELGQLDKTSFWEEQNSSQTAENVTSNEMMNNCLFSVFQVNCHLWGKLSNRIRTLNMKSTPVAVTRDILANATQEPLSSVTTVLINIIN